MWEARWLKIRVNETGICLGRAPQWLTDEQTPGERCCSAPAPAPFWGEQRPQMTGKATPELPVRGCWKAATGAVVLSCLGERQPEPETIAAEMSRTSVKKVPSVIWLSHGSFKGRRWSVQEAPRSLPRSSPDPVLTTPGSLQLQTLGDSFP